MSTTVTECKEAFAKGDLAKAYSLWCKIYEEFDDDQEGLFKAMTEFTNEEVYGITDYGREKYYREKGYK